MHSVVSQTTNIKLIYCIFVILNEFRSTRRGIKSPLDIQRRKSFVERSNDGFESVPLNEDFANPLILIIPIPAVN